MEVKQQVKEDGPQTVMNDFLKYGEIYAELKRPSASNQSADILNDLDLLGQEQAFVPLLAAGARFGVRTSDFNTIADALLVFIVRHQVCGQSSNKLDKVFSNACEFIKDESKSAEEVSRFFKKNQQKNEDFESYFANLRFEHGCKDQRKARVYLKRIEQKEWGSDQPFSLEDSKLTIEHIMPKQPDRKELVGWIGESRADEIIQGGQAEIDKFTNDCVKSVGNLALLYAPENASAGNACYAEKLKVYGSPLIDGSGEERGVPKEVFKLIGELVLDYPESFDEGCVIKRAKTLAGKAVLAWA